jgi:hypothetical protein
MSTVPFVAFVALASSASALGAPPASPPTLAVSLVVFDDLGGDAKPVVLDLGSKTSYFTFKDGEIEVLRIKLIPLPNCRVSIEAEAGHFESRSPAPWPSAFGPRSNFVFDIPYPRHRRELRGAVIGKGTCAVSTPNTSLERTRGR